MERHPVWTGALVGFGAGVLLTYAVTHDNGKVLIGVGIAVAVLVGTCAVALNSESPQPVTTNEVPQRPIPSDRP